MIIGITGGTGCGKTTLLGEIAERGGLILDCDSIYHELLRSDAEMLSQIAQRFPSAVENGVLDRKTLGEQVFSDEQALLDLNAITHRAVKAEVQRRLDGVKGLAAIDAIALFESGLSELCDVTVAVSAPRADRIRRLMKRDGISREYACKRIDAQKDADFFARHCDAVLYNGGDLEDFRLKCRQWLEQLCCRRTGLEEHDGEK